LFDPKPFKYEDFWFTKGFFIDENIDSDDIQVKQKVAKKEGNIETLSIQQVKDFFEKKNKKMLWF
jgi:hypothetical protein